MTAKDFELIAKVLREAKATIWSEPTDEEGYLVESGKDLMAEDIVYRFADELAKTNPRFKPALFIREATRPVKVHEKP